MAIVCLLAPRRAKPQARPPGPSGDPARPAGPLASGDHSPSPAPRQRGPRQLARRPDLDHGIFIGRGKWSGLRRIGRKGRESDPGKKSRFGREVGCVESSKTHLIGKRPTNRSPPLPGRYVFEASTHPTSLNPSASNPTGDQRTEGADGHQHQRRRLGHHGRIRQVGDVLGRRPREMAAVVEADTDESVRESEPNEPWVPITRRW